MGPAPHTHELTWLARLTARVQRTSVWTRAGLLCGPLVALYALLAPLAAVLGGRSALLAATLALWFCLVAGLLAMLVQSLLSRGGNPLSGMLFGMLLRTGLPLGLALVCQLASPALAEAGFLYYLLGFYLPTLLIETLLTLPAVPAGPSKA
jgi:hypothetical protein